MYKNDYDHSICTALQVKLSTVLLVTCMVSTHLCDDDNDMSILETTRVDYVMQKQDVRVCHRHVVDFTLTKLKCVNYLMIIVG